jgi:hypothetical protein
VGGKGGGGDGGKMNQALYAHMNNKRKKNHPQTKTITRIMTPRKMHCAW